jgi:hypothetical protein
MTVPSGATDNVGWDMWAGNGCKDIWFRGGKQPGFLSGGVRESIAGIEESVSVTSRVLRETFVTLSLRFESDYDKHLRLAV